MSNRNARNPTHYFDINSYSNASLFSVCIVLTTLRCSCINNNTSSIVSFCCNVTSISTINFSLVRAVYSPTLYALQKLRSGNLWNLYIGERLVFLLAVSIDRKIYIYYCFCQLFFSSCNYGYSYLLQLSNRYSLNKFSNLSAWKSSQASLIRLQIILIFFLFFYL